MAVYKIIAAVIQTIEAEVTIDLAAASSSSRTPGDAIRDALRPERVAIEDPGVQIIQSDAQPRIALKSAHHSDTGRVARSLNRPFVPEEDDGSRYASECANCGEMEPRACLERDWRCSRCCPVHGVGGHPNAVLLAAMPRASAAGNPRRAAPERAAGEREATRPPLWLVRQPSRANPGANGSGRTRRFRKRVTAPRSRPSRSASRRRAAA